MKIDKSPHTHSKKAHKKETLTIRQRGDEQITTKTTGTRQKKENTHTHSPHIYTENDFKIIQAGDLRIPITKIAKLRFRLQ